MPITIKSTELKYKNPSTGQYQGIDTIAETTTSQQCALIEAKGAETIASIPSDYTALSNSVNEEIAERKTYTKPNILDNWYFAGGGSQSDAGKFPINQRGQTPYSTTDTTTIDRWILRQGSLTIPSSNDCIKFTRIEQHIDDGLFNQLIGKQITFSILTANNQLYSYTAVASSGNWMATTPTGYSFVGWGHTVQITDSNAVGVVAVKLELGDMQTLAHQENGVWVLNELPNYQYELAKCQMYQIALNPTGGNYQWVGNGVIWSATEADAFIPTPVTMRAQPTAEDVANWKLWTPDQIAVTSVTFNRVSGGLKAIFAITGGTAGKPFVVGTGATDSKLIVSCNI